MQILVLGGAAGGGFPQWNCNCSNCRRARANDPAAVPRTQSSLAVSSDGVSWLLLNASPDLRQQIFATGQLHPRQGVRDSPIAGAVLTNGDIDHAAGLLSLRENQPLVVHAARRVLDVLSSNPIFNVLHPDMVVRRELPLDAAVSMRAADGSPLGLDVTAFPVPGKLPLYLEGTIAGRGLSTQPGDTIGLEVADGSGRRLYYVPACAAMPPELSDRLRGAELVFFDGTLWRDDEMIVAGVGSKTGKRMGHMSISGEHGTMSAFAPLGVRRKILVHINNTNPVLLADSAERAEVEASGWEVAHDGMEVRL